MSSGSGESSDTLYSEDESEDKLPGTSDGNVVINDAASAFNVGMADDYSSLCIHFPSFDVMCAPNFIWGDVTCETFAHSVTCCYDEVVHWRKSLFKIPLAKCGRAFVTKQAHVSFVPMLMGLLLNVLLYKLL